MENRGGVKEWVVRSLGRPLILRLQVRAPRWVLFFVKQFNILRFVIEILK